MARNGVTSVNSYEEARAALVRSLRGHVTDKRVLEAIGRVPRERFVSPDLRPLAYADKALPIGHGQTISQPTMVAIMLQMLHLTGNERVLEVGGGSGYQAALLGELAESVVSVELVPGLADSAAKVLSELGYTNVSVHHAGETLGWLEGAPYDAIIVAAASPRIPQSLVEQLAPGGTLVIPVGTREQQDLLVAEKRPEGLSVRREGGCRFVPLLGDEAYH
jgi:protein-L-isoaspartate(D-aspartate) O-methyltransferase